MNIPSAYAIAETQQIQPAIINIQEKLVNRINESVKSSGITNVGYSSSRLVDIQAMEILKPQFESAGYEVTITSKKEENYNYHLSQRPYHHNESRIVVSWKHIAKKINPNRVNF